MCIYMAASGKSPMKRCTLKRDLWNVSMKRESETKYETHGVKRML